MLFAYKRNLLKILQKNNDKKINEKFMKEENDFENNKIICKINLIQYLHIK